MSIVEAVCYFNPDQYPPVINSTRLLVKAGFELSLLCRGTGPEWGVDYPAGSHIQRLKTPNRSSWGEYIGFIKQVIRLSHPQATVFIGHDMHGLFPAWLLAKRHRRPLFYHCHDFAENSQTLALGGRLVKAIERQIARSAHLVIVPDVIRGQTVTKHLRLLNFPLVAANAPLAPFTGSGQILYQALAQRGKFFDHIVFRQGRIGPGHAIEPTIRSIPQWLSPKWGFVVMGMGDENYIAHIQKLAGEQNVAEQFAVLPPVSYDQVSQFTIGATIGHALYEPTDVNNLHSTTSSNKTMEYMAAGLPLLVSSRPGQTALINTHQCGLTANETDPNSIAHAINTLLSQPQLLHQQGLAAREAFCNTFSYEKQFIPVIEAIQQLQGSNDAN